MTINRRTNKCPSRYLCLSEAKKIIALANIYEREKKKKYLYKIHKALNIRIDRIKRVLDKAFYTKKFMPRINQQ